MSLNGKLDTLPFGDLVQIIANGMKMGTLELSRDGEALRFVFERGRIIGSMQGNLSADDHLRFLIARGKLLSRAETVSLEKIAKKRSQTFTQTMLGMNLIDEDVVFKALTDCTRSLFSEAMDWNSGRFIFRDTEEDELPAMRSELRVDEMLLAAFT